MGSPVQSLKEGKKTMFHQHSSRIKKEYQIRDRILVTNTLKPTQLLAQGKNLYHQLHLTPLFQLKKIFNFIHS